MNAVEMFEEMKELSLKKKIVVFLRSFNFRMQGDVVVLNAIYRAYGLPHRFESQHEAAEDYFRIHRVNNTAMCHVTEKQAVALFLKVKEKGLEKLLNAHDEARAVLPSFIKTALQAVDEEGQAKAWKIYEEYGLGIMENGILRAEMKHKTNLISDIIYKGMYTDSYSGY